MSEILRPGPRTVRAAVLVYAAFVLVMACRLGFLRGDVDAAVIVFAGTGITTLLLAPVFPSIAIFAFVGVVYAFPRYSDAQEFILRNFIPETIALLGLFGFVIATLARTPPARPRIHALSWVMLALVAWSAVTAAAVVLGSDDWFALRAHFDMKHHPGRYVNAACLFIIAVFAREPAKLVTGLALTLGIVLVGKWWLYSAEIDARPGDFAQLAVITLPLCLAAAVAARGPLPRVLGAILATGLAAALYAVQNRAAAVAFVALLVALWLQSNHKRIALAVALPIVFGVAALTYDSSYWQRFEDATGALHGTPDAGVSERLALWRSAARVAADHWLFGVGPGRSPRYLAEHTPAGVDKTYAVHNNFLAVLLELGVIGFVLYCVLFGGVIVLLWRCGRGDGRVSPRTEARCLLASLVAYAAAGMFVTRHDQALPYILAGAALALVSAAGSVPRTRGRERTSSAGP